MNLLNLKKKPCCATVVGNKTFYWILGKTGPASLTTCWLRNRWIIIGSSILETEDHKMLTIKITFSDVVPVEQ